MLSVYSYLEFYLTLFAWIINNGIFFVLRDTGIAAWPIAAIIFNEWISARDEGADEGNKALLTVYRVENRVYLAYLVILFAFVPSIEVTLSEPTVDDEQSQACIITRYAADDRRAGVPNGVTQFEQSIGEHTAKIPIWWALVHALSKGITKAASTAVPCEPDIRSVLMEIDEMRIDDPHLLEEVRAFTHDCFAKATQQLGQDKPRLSKEEDADIGWVGSSYLRSHYYEKFKSEKPLPGFDDTATGKPVVVGAGYPTCEKWWTSEATRSVVINGETKSVPLGLRKRLIENVGTGLVDEIQAIFSSDNAEDIMLRKIISPEHQERTDATENIFPRTEPGEREKKSGWDKFWGVVKNVGTTAGLALGLGAVITGLNVARSSLPMMQSFILMSIIICLPLLLVISKYEIKTVVTISFAMFATHFCTFWWELARWLDSSLWAALYAEANGFEIALDWLSADESTISQLVLQFVMATLFFVLPAFFMGMMGWAGAEVGDSISKAMEKGSSEAMQRGAEGGQMMTKKAVGLTTKVAKKAGDKVVTKVITKFIDREYASARESAKESTKDSAKESNRGASSGSTDKSSATRASDKGTGGVSGSSENKRGGAGDFWGMLNS